MTDIRKSLDTLADELERLSNKPASKPEILDRELSGNKINGGRITNFSSAGIRDEAKDFALVVRDEGIFVDAINAPVINNPLTVKGSLTVEGEITATRLHVDEISADIRHERTSPLEFRGDNGTPYGKGLIWTGGGYTKQFVLQKGDDRLWSSEHIDLHNDKEYRISNTTVLSANSLGPTVFNSNLRTVGTLEGLEVEGHVNIDNFVKYDANTQQFGVGANELNGMFTMESWDHQFVIDPTDDRKWKIGTWTTCELQIVTDDTTRLSIGPNGHIVAHNKASFLGKVGIGSKNFSEDVDLSVAGPIRFDNRKFQSGDAIPTSGNYIKGDIVWNNNPAPTGYVGWICVRAGTPGEWKPFGQITS